MTKNQHHDLILHSLGKNISCINFLVHSYPNEKEEEHSEGTFLYTLDNPGFVHILNTQKYMVK